MALEYTLSFDGIEDIFSILNSEFKNANRVFEIDKNEKQYSINLYDYYGFFLVISHRENVHLGHFDSLNMLNEREIKDCSRLYFRLAKSFDNIIAKRNVVDFCVKILRRTTSDAFLVFNWDYLIFERINGVLKINKNNTFWNYMNFNFETELKGLPVRYL